MTIHHHAELSDVHGIIIHGHHKSLFFLPDQVSWADTLSVHNCVSIRHFLQKMRVDIALIDGTFWSFDKLADSRNQMQVPHPPVAQTLNFLGSRLPQDPEIFFIHLNHTNPLYDFTSSQYQTLQAMGWKVATQGMKFVL